jgi:hypothetical protein
MRGLVSTFLSRKAIIFGPNLVRMNRRIIQLVALLFLVASASSCSLFRKKNKCVSCPTWHDEIQTEVVVEEQPQY